MSIEKPSLSTEDYFDTEESYYTNNSSLLPFMETATDITNAFLDSPRSSAIAAVIIIASPDYATFRTNVANEGTPLQVPRSKRLTHE